MKTSAKSLLVFGVYLIGMGLGFVLLPNLLLGMLGLPPTTEVWSRVVGMFALLLAFYYIQAARANLQPFIQWTVYTRIAVFFFFTAFVIGGLAGPILILLGSVDLLAAGWTEWAIRKEKKTSFREPRPAASLPTPKTQP
jgi:hypothetical protein